MSLNWCVCVAVLKQYTPEDQIVQAAERSEARSQGF